MNTILLNTKISIPPGQSNIVPRQRLTQLINSRSQAGSNLTLVAAPAGFGKTTAILNWIQYSDRPAAWVSLEEDDNEEAVFWMYVISALQTVYGGFKEPGIDKPGIDKPGFEAPGFGTTALMALRSPQPGSIKTVLVDVINELGDLPQQVTLVLDDYHVIANREIHEGMSFLLEHQPPQLHLVIATRADPPLPLARLRGRRLMTEIREDDLRFSGKETQQFLNEIMELELSPQDIQALESRTEGWIVGLLLAALSMQGWDDKHGFIQTFSGGHHYILGYLVEEVLNHQTEPMREFLLQTCVLSKLCGPLCDALTGQNNGEETLEQLQANNLFILSLDHEHRWFRYHHLFSDLLQNLQRRQLLPEEIDELHRRASQWYQANGAIEDAIKHSLQAKDMQLAASLIEQAALKTMSQGRLTTFLGWLDGIPEQALNARPRLRYLQAWALHLSGQSDVAERMLLNARETLLSQPPSDDNLALRGELAALLTGIATLHEDRSRVYQTAQEALTYLPEGDLVSRARIHIALGTAYAYDDELDGAIQAWGLARDLALEADNLFLATAAIELLAGGLIYYQGHLREAVDTLQGILKLGTTQDGSLLPFTATAHALLAEIYVEWNELEAAADYLALGIKLANRGGIGYGLTYIYCVQARLYQALGDSEEALEALQAAARSLGPHLLWHMVVQQITCQVRLRLSLGDIQTAWRWASGDPELTRREQPKDLSAYLSEMQLVSLARVHLVKGETEEALAILDTLLPQAEASDRMARVAEITLCKAMALHQQGDLSGAMEAFEKCLSVCEQEGYTRLFIEAGVLVIVLLRQAASEGLHPAYVEKLLQAFEGSKPKTTITSAIKISIPKGDQPLVEPLTAREQEVLKLISEGKSNQEIAEFLVVSLNTVKKHSSNIYGKLSVRSRTQAIIRAKELNII